MVFCPFGDCRNSTGTLGTDQLYTGQRLDGTGLYFYNARYYDSSIGRFISPDDVAPDYSNPQDLNRYSYVHNNPLTYNDPTGHKTSLGEDDNGNDIWVSNDGTRLSTYLPSGFDPMYSGGHGDFVPSQGTVGGRLQFSVGLGIGINMQVMGVVDSKGQTATAITLSLIGTTPTFGIGPVAQRTDAKDVSDLSQLSGGAGASSWFTPGYDV